MLIINYNYTMNVSIIMNDLILDSSYMFRSGSIDINESIIMNGKEYIWYNELFNIIVFILCIKYF